MSAYLYVHACMLSWLSDCLETMASAFLQQLGQKRAWRKHVRVTVVSVHCIIPAPECVAFQPGVWMCRFSAWRLNVSLFSPASECVAFCIGKKNKFPIFATYKTCFFDVYFLFHAVYLHKLKVELFHFFVFVVVCTSYGSFLCAC